MTSKALEIYCGAKALEKIQQNGFRKEDVKVMVGASGGAKWLSLSRLDQVLFPEILKDRKEPLYCLGSSIGTWRFMCAAQKDPAKAFQKFEETYINFKYQEPVTTKSILEDSYYILDQVLGKTGVEDALSHPQIRTSFMAVKCKGLLKFEDKFLLPTGLLLGAFLNIFSRKTLGLQMKRALFTDQRDLPPFYDMTGFPIDKTPLTTENYKDALMASSTIPMVMDPIYDISGAGDGVYRDGGFIDYHFDLPFLGGEEGLVLYPHFFPKISPGWFDKLLPWQRFSRKNYENVVLICPSEEFASSLPGGKIPNRSDFKTYDEKTRISNWKKAVTECDRLADEMNDLFQNNLWGERSKPLLF